MNETSMQVAVKPYSMVATSFDDAMRIADILAKSELVPKDFRGKPANVFVAMQWGMEIGLQTLQALQNIAVINGRPSIWGDAALALVKSHKDCQDVIEKLTGEGEKSIATCIVKRKGCSPVESSFSVDDAKRARLWGKEGPWTNYPKRMLQLRARAFALRDAFPDALKGIGIAEEMQDIEIEINQRPDTATSTRKGEVVDAETGEVTLPPYTQEQIDEHLSKWVDLIMGGKKTAEQIIATIETRNSLTEEQRNQILSYKKTQEEQQ